jgi:uncharacterized protein (DUF934 family)
MPRRIKNGQIIDDTWQAADADAAPPADDQVHTLGQWLALADKSGRAVQLEADEAPAPLLDHLNDLPLVVVHFTNFMDGRGFSYGRELRERGYQGELRASGAIIRDQLTYLQRLGFDAFALAEDGQLEGALDSLGDFSEYYQAAIDQPQPLFRRR